MNSIIKLTRYEVFDISANDVIVQMSAVAAIKSLIEFFL